ncbi:MAG: UPF0182 family protein [Pseudomonadota bacterium]|jgi:uncharacterized membrane protein (UPF0182 family)
MGNWKRLLISAAVVIAVLAGLLLALIIAATHFLVDWWWFRSLDLGAYFWLRFLYRYILSGGVTLFFFLIFFLNFWAASQYLGIDQAIYAASSEESRYRRWLRMFQTGALPVYLPLSLFLAVLVALPFYQEWEAGLLFFFAPDTGVPEPVFGDDVGFHMFRLPILLLLQWELLVCVGILAVTVAALYWVEHEFSPAHRRPWPRGARLHLNALVVLVAGVAAWGYVLQQENLVYVDVNEPIFFGPGLLELRYHLPLIWVEIVALVVGVAAALWFAQRNRGLKLALTCALVWISAAGLRKIDVLPKLIDRFVIKPNPVKTQREYIKYNIEATLTAFDLDEIRTIDITAVPEGSELIDPNVREHLHNIPVWDPEYLDDVYQQLQGIRPYYSFTAVDTARYLVNGQIEQVNLAARELNVAKLPREAQNWENIHLRFTHGYGAVITPAAQSADQPMRWWLRDLSMHSDVGVTTEKPDIYFGLENLDYAIVPNRLKIVDIASFDQYSSQNYTGTGGVPISSLLRRLLLSIYFRDEKLFFSPNITTSSQALFRRNIVERINTVTPFLAIDGYPYIVVTPQRIFWVVDAYTTLNSYPVSKRMRYKFRGDTGEREFNYIRNSVKIVVDAFDGSLDYYVMDHDDPLLKGYIRAYPGLFQDASAMPPLIREQLRFPRDFFEIQMRMYAKYHQTQPELFFQQAETWDFAKVGVRLGDGRTVTRTMAPFFFTTQLDACEKVQNFVLINPMTPIERDNMSALAIGGALRPEACGMPYSKSILLYKYRKDVQVDGPAQVSAKIDQDAEIAKEFALWDQRGSHLTRGRIIILPIGRTLLYVQPVYIESTSSVKIPELARIILSMGDIVVMETSLEAALNKLEARLIALQKARGIVPVTPVRDAPGMHPM